MLLGVDIGNTTVYFGAIKNDVVGKTFRIATKKDITAEEYTVNIRKVLEENLDIKEISKIIISSVVPEITNEIEQALVNITKVVPIVLKRDIRKTAMMNEEIVNALGADLIANSNGAVAKFDAPIMIFDMGTATTCCVINKQKDFIGGMICPGLKTSVDALIGKASQLSNFTLGNPKQVIGLDTPECINAGSIYGHAAMINGLKKKVEDETNEKYTVILTGGNSEYVEKYIDSDIIVDRNLIFYGLNEIYKNY